MMTTICMPGRRPAATLTPRTTLATAMLAAWLASGCGGGHESELAAPTWAVAATSGPPAAVSTAANPRAPALAVVAARATVAAQAAAMPTPALIADDGSVMPSDPRARPADAAAWTRSSRYATARQAQQLIDALGDRVLQVQVECCGIEGVDQAVGIAWGLQASGLAEDTPVLVRGVDLRLAAAAANRLSSGGMTHVWLVTP